MTKVQLTLTDQEAAILLGYGDQFGYKLPKIAKYFISKAAEEIHKLGMISVYEMSEKTEQRGLDALADHRAGKTKEITNVEDYFSNA